MSILKVAVMGEGHYHEAIDLLRKDEFDAVVTWWHMDELGKTWGGIYAYCKDKEVAEEIFNMVPLHDGSIGEFKGFPELAFPAQLAAVVSLLEFPLGAEITRLDVEDT